MYLTSLVLPRITSTLYTGRLCVALHPRANYILVSFGEIHPDKHCTWLPFPPAHSNPSLWRGERGRETEEEDREKPIEWCKESESEGGGV